MGFQTIVDTGALDSLMDNSNERPVVVFKHSLACPISAVAYREMQKLDGEVVLVEVQNARQVSRELADRTGIRHESPQVIVFRNGKAVWNASHYDVKAHVVSKALEAHA
ncbi:MAG TPA: bacillithiol system redox-active protein YtxJ [Pyrinomonadaceae bacterium]|nr:bacillithiol system redox-active protein YtxJ [Pyrinomonadaceae bacterium]